MRCPDIIRDEAQRLRMLAEYGLSSEASLPSLDPIVEIAVRLFQVPASAVNMIGSDHVFFAASRGIGECDLSRDVSICAHAITQDEVMVVMDALLDLFGRPVPAEQFWQKFGSQDKVGQQS